MAVDCRKRLLGGHFSTNIILGGAALAVLLAPCASAQAPASPTTATPTQKTAQHTFAAVSLRPGGKKNYMIGLDYLGSASKEELPKDGLVNWNITLGYLISFAYDLRESHEVSAMLQSLPKWTQGEWYVVQARVEGSPSRAEVRAMLRSLLEERFKIAAHTETHEGDVYALTFVKSGKQFRPHPTGEPCMNFVPLGSEIKRPFPYPSYEQVHPFCGVFVRQLSPSKDRLEMLDVTTQQVAESVGGFMPLPVIDKTGLTGNYDAIIDFWQGIPPANADPTMEVGQPIETNIEKLFGLKFTKQKAQLERFVIDHIEQPSEN
jgi:uncharacterized protein (TIGR03435 family)